MYSLSMIVADVALLNAIWMHHVSALPMLLLHASNDSLPLACPVNLSQPAELSNSLALKFHRLDSYFVNCSCTMRTMKNSVIWTVSVISSDQRCHRLTVTKRVMAGGSSLVNLREIKVTVSENSLKYNFWRFTPSLDDHDASSVICGCWQYFPSGRINHPSSSSLIEIHSAG